MPDYRLVPIEQLVEPVMPARFAMDDAKMNSLVESVRANGILQNLIVVPVSHNAEGTPRDLSVAPAAEVPARPGGGDIGAACAPTPVPPLGADSAPLYEIVAGHRRYKAAVTVGLAVVPCMIFAEREIGVHAARLAENVEREDITAAEEAIYYSELLEKYDYTEEQLLQTVRQNSEYVYTRLAILKGHKFVFDALAARLIALGVAVQLNRVDDPSHAQYLLGLAVDGGATIRMVNKWVAEYKANGPGPVVTLAASTAPADGAAAVPVTALCVLCGNPAYPANIKWVPIHDFELDAILRNIDAAARLPGAASGEPGENDARG